MPQVAPFPHIWLLPMIALILTYLGWAAPNASEYNLLNYAKPEFHPYADSTKGRENHRYTDAQVNENRLYDFYSRQADYYIEQGEVPDIIPAYPGMDAGIHSHWGTYPQVHSESDAWAKMDNGPIVGSVMAQGSEFIVKALHLKLREGDDWLYATFDPLSLSYRFVWNGEFLRYPTKRWGITGLVEPDGEIFLQRISNNGLSKQDGDSYQGYYLVGDQIVFKCQYQGADILEQPSALDNTSHTIFVRTLKFTNDSPSIEVKSFDIPSGARRSEEILDSGLAWAIFRYGQSAMGIAVRSSNGAEGIEITASENRSLSIQLSPQPAGSVVTIYSWNGDGDASDSIESILMHQPIDPEQFTDGGLNKRMEEIVLSGEFATADDPYVIDTLPIPFENPHGSPMFLTGLDFFPNGDAAVSTFFGDVWIVRGIGRDLKEIRWKRVAKGLNQPLGLLVIDGKIHTLGKDQITVLHDLNGDEEADFYENFCNSYITSPGSHDYNTGFQKDDVGNLYFATKHAGIIKVSPDGKRVFSLGAGLRNPNGIGVSPDGRVWCSPQEGQWTPASQIIRIQPDGYYGFQRHIDRREITPATAYIPRGIDNSSGGSVYINTDRWGPMKDKLVAFSFGASSHYLVLEDTSGSVPQGAIVPLKGNFLSGTHRARVHPIDGQVYVVGSQGWMNYAIQDGSFERIRYTGKPVYYPSGFNIFSNGIRIDFNEPLATWTDNENPHSHFAQQWQYLYSMGYGSPEFSIREPGTVGHDPISISSANVIEDGKSLFLEIPDLGPAMTVHLRLHLNFADGNSFATDLFATVHDLGNPFLEIPQPRNIVSGKLSSIELPIRDAPQVPELEAGRDEPGRAIELKAITGLKYDQERVVVQAGERISLTLINTDEMPHNWVLTGWFTYELVGQLADAMVSDPTAAERHYVPDDPSVLFNTHILNPGESQTIHFNAPSEPGKYPFLCTFPGHWQTMKGTLIVY